MIMDGNSRWAEKNGLPPLLGYERGVESLRRVVRCCCQWGVPVLTVFAFSADNWRRAEAEVSVLLGLIGRCVRQELPALQKAGVKLLFFGDLERLPPSLQNDMQSASLATSSNQTLTLCIAVSYSGRGEALRAARQLAERVRSGHLTPEDVDEEIFREGLSSASLPREFQDPDLLIRTSGEQRLSDFMLWEMAYTEFYFSSLFWPEFDEEAFKEALLSYTTRDRRYGSH
eukprot:CAMPEP_0196592396 /NCGR_PEP_ID=MMETSP1081-20130531/72642_1 /TAXON_ID=36882 /ORGANISM="Pyramimonas amylifera, Strain CCMP720" /LENGTH=228 /DNA_ID=CAMNT_0041916083 /DNA_START=725 /DNA_END=1411 /DNA_ORIENTATION=+